MAGHAKESTPLAGGKGDSKNKVAIGKWLKLSKIQQQMLAAVLFTSLVLGVTLVLLVWFVKYINFNKKVITGKDQAIASYEKVITAVGICVDKNKDGKYNNDELNACRPEDVDVNSMPGTLRYNMMVTMANNTDLESVARERVAECYEDGRKIDYKLKYDEAETDEQRTYWLSMMRVCSALRVIPDALPAQKNTEALMSSLNQIFILSGWEPESLSPGSGGGRSPVSGLGVMPVNVSVEADAQQTMTVLNNLERSIRTFDIQTATIAWSGENLELRATGNAYYATAQGAVETTKVVYASDDARKAAR